MRIYSFATFLLAVFVLPAYASEDINCPAMPSSVTAINRDVRVDFESRVGSLGKISAGEVAAKTAITAKTLFEKYPNVDRLLAIQMMASTYCSLLRSTRLTPAERLHRWSEFSDKVFSLQNDSGKPAAKADLPLSKKLSKPDVPTATNKPSISSFSSPHSTPQANGFLEKHQPPLLFVVGADSLYSESLTYLQTLARGLRDDRGIAVRLIPFTSREFHTQPFSTSAQELTFRRQSQIRSVLMQAGVLSAQIVFVTNRMYGNTSDQIFDDNGRPIEPGLDIELAKRDI